MTNEQATDMTTEAKTKTIEIHYAGGFGQKTVTVPGPYRSLAEMKSANRQRRIDGLQGGEYWGKQEMRFFNGKVFPTVYQGRFVIDSRQFVGSDGYRAPREYCVCMVSDDGDVEKVAFVVGVDDKGQQVFKDEFLSRELALLALRLMLYENRK